LPYFSKLYVDELLPPRAKLVFFYLHDIQDDKGKAWPSINTIAREVSLSRSTVKRAIADLEEAGYIRKKQARRNNGSLTSNRYYLKPETPPPRGDSAQNEDIEKPEDLLGKARRDVDLA
jgi:DNA-binding transcriptional MocR family regulator